ncbi:Hypothetical_protein [Hexamita inflata]|uniref:Hypothetical_protein n=1 Tax=Hexamita inflata TaxID=28002 RepID=A0AA86TN40_9EUKA|nr:Hypothetical protein HINF_LOCUS10051 [Hexamita inflata]
MFEIFVESVGQTHVFELKYANCVAHVQVGTDEIFQIDVPAGQLQLFEEFVEPYGQQQAPAVALKYEFVVLQTQLDLSVVGVIPDGHALHSEVVASCPPAQMKKFAGILHASLTIVGQSQGHQHACGETEVQMNAYVVLHTQILLITYVFAASQQTQTLLFIYQYLITLQVQTLLIVTEFAGQFVHVLFPDEQNYKLVLQVQVFVMLFGVDPVGHA